MTDREQLELAAKAAGWKWWRSKHGYWELTDPNSVKQKPCCLNWLAFDPYSGVKLTEPTLYDALIEVGFDPENDSGQAFDLAVKLKMPIQFPDWTDVTRTWGSKDCLDAFDEPHGTDPLAATRRAIVRAAAEIGRSNHD